MQVTILGTGTATPSLERNASGIAVSAEGMLMLVDIGPGTIRRLCEAGIDWRSVDAILVTHFHADHVSDLAPFLFASNYAYGPVREAPFHLVGPNGLERHHEGLIAIYDHWVVPTGNRLIKKEMSADGPDAFSLGRVKLISAPSRHSFPSISYRIESEGVSVTVTGDTDVSEELVELASGTDVLICECSMPEGQKVSGHLVPSEAGWIAARARVKKLVLTHFSPPCDEADVLEQAAVNFSGDIVKAADLMIFTV